LINVATKHPNSNRGAVPRTPRATVIGLVPDGTASIVTALLARGNVQPSVSRNRPLRWGRAGHRFRIGWLEKPEASALPLT
jgi:hypothetical protein